jgi:hypothetical protein
VYVNVLSIQSIGQLFDYPVVSTEGTVKKACSAFFKSKITRV